MTMRGTPATLAGRACASAVAALRLALASAAMSSRP